jgi:hypothetical protein
LGAEETDAKWRILTSVNKAPAVVNSLRANPSALIALHSPDAVVETGLHDCPPEKSGEYGGSAADYSILCSPLCLGIIAKYGHSSLVPVKTS